MNEPRIEEQSAHHYVAVRARVSAETFRDVVDSRFQEPFAWLAGKGVAPAGAPFIRYLELDRSGDPAEIELAVPVASPVGSDGDVISGEMPGGRYLLLEHDGPYSHQELDDLRDAHDALDAYVSENGFEVEATPTGEGLSLAAAAEYYEVGPPTEPDFTKWRTRIVRRLTRR